MSQEKLTPKQMLLIREALSADQKKVDIRLREGEYQYALVRAIASFLLELYFPNVKEITERLYGKAKAESIQFRRKIQTILKKMEKSDVVKILPKKKPWELQTYGLSSFKFEDVDKDSVIFAEDQKIEELHDLLDSLPSEVGPRAEAKSIRKEILALLFTVITSCVAVFWGLMQPTINPFVFVPAFSLAVVFSVMLGTMLSRK